MLEMQEIRRNSEIIFWFVFLKKNFVKKGNINHSFVFVTREELDLSSKSNIKSYFKNHKFDLIINCAAFNHRRNKYRNNFVAIFN